MVDYTQERPNAPRIYFPTVVLKGKQTKKKSPLRQGLLTLFKGSAHAMCFPVYELCTCNVLLPDPLALYGPVPPWGSLSVAGPAPTHTDNRKAGCV